MKRHFGPLTTIGLALGCIAGLYLYTVPVQTQVQAPPVLINGAAQGTGTKTPVLTDASGALLPGQRVTYAAALTAKTATAAGTSPFLAICGSASKTVRVQYVAVGGSVATAAVYGDVILTKTSTATSSGTPTALTAVPLDSGSSAATVNLLNFYTVLATTGSAVGPVDAQSAEFPITGTVSAPMANLVFDWTGRTESQAPILRGTAQCLQASFGTTTTNAPTLTVALKWTEE
jgi:hypothetical protein